LPLELDVWFAAPPHRTAYLAQEGAAVEKSPGVWRVTLAKGIDADAADAIIHRIVEQTLAGAGRLRKIGVAEPALDDLFAHYINESDRGGVGGN
jgi:hypothetical protein